MTRIITIMYDFYLCSYSDFFFFSSSLLNYRFPYCIQFYSWSTQQVIVAQHMCWFLKASNPPMFSPYELFQLYPIRADGFPFPSIYGPPYPTFQSHLVLLPFDVLLALLLVGDLSHLCIFYHNCKGWGKHSSWSCWIPLVTWPRRDTSGELNHLWILSWCHMDYISFGSLWLVLWLQASNNTGILNVNILSWLTGRAIISPDTLEKRRHYGMTGSKQTAILVYVRV